MGKRRKERIENKTRTSDQLYNEELKVTISLEEVERQLDCKQKKIQEVRKNIKDIENKHTELLTAHQTLETESNTLKLLCEDLAQRDNFLKYFDKLWDSFIPKENRSKELIQLVEPLIELKKIMLEKNLVQSTGILLATLIDNLAQTNHQRILCEISSQIALIEKSSHMSTISTIDDQETNVDVDLDFLNDLFPETVVESQNSEIVMQENVDIINAFYELPLEEYNPFYPDMSPTEFSIDIF